VPRKKDPLRKLPANADLHAGAFLGRARRFKGLTQGEVAQRGHVARQRVGQWEQGDLPWATLPALLNVGVAYGLATSEMEHLFRLLGLELPPHLPQWEVVLPSLPLLSIPAPDRVAASNLPAELSTFVGRAVAIEEVSRLVRGQHRLVTLTGPGGVGKTRLAVRAAKRIQADGTFADGVWLIHLEALFSADQLTQQLAQVLNVGQASSETLLAIVTSYLSNKKMLLILDNCEHLLEPSSILVRALLEAAPDLQIIATSREPLGLWGEVDWPVPPLTTPGEDSLDTPRQAPLAYEAVELFLERALTALPSFALTEQNTSDVIAIACQLDGLPLLIELAAARLKDLRNTHEIRSRLNDVFSLLVRGDKTGPERQRTVQAVVEWSVALLSESERALFYRASVFSGGWSLEAAVAVTSDVLVPPDDVEGLLANLVHSALVVSEDVNGQRYRLLETLRQYGKRQLALTDEITLWSRRHAGYFCDLAESGEAFLWSNQQASWFPRFNRELNNFRAALQWCLTEDPQIGLRVAAHLWRFWQLRGFLREADHWLSLLLATTTASSQARAYALVGLGYIARNEWDLDRASRLSQSGKQACEALADNAGVLLAEANLGIIARAHGEYREAMQRFVHVAEAARLTGDRRALGSRLWNLGATARAAGDRRIAKLFFDRSLVILRQVQERHALALVLRFMGLLHQDGAEYSKAQVFYRESLKVAQELGDNVGIGAALCGLGDLARSSGNITEAQRLLRSSIRILQDAGDALEQAWASIALGMVSLGTDELPEAARLFQDSLTVFVKVQERRATAHSLQLLGIVALLLGEYEAGLSLIDGAIGYHPPEVLSDSDVQTRRSALDKTIQYLGQARFDELHDRAQPTSLRQLLELAFSVAVVDHNAQESVQATEEAGIKWTS